MRFQTRADWCGHGQNLRGSPFWTMRTWFSTAWWRKSTFFKWRHAIQTVTLEEIFKRKSINFIFYFLFIFIYFIYFFFFYQFWSILYLKKILKNLTQPLINGCNHVQSHRKLTAKNVCTVGCLSNLKIQYLIVAACSWRRDKGE